MAQLPTSTTEALPNRDSSPSSHEHLARFIDGMAEGAGYCQLVYDESGHAVDWIIQVVNAAAATLFNLPFLAGRAMTDLLPDVHLTNPEVLATFARVASSGKPERIEGWNERLSLWFRLSVSSPMQGHVLVLGDNITAEKQAQAELQISQRQLALALDSSGAATWSWDVSANKVTWDEHYYGIFGVDRSEQPSYESWIATVHPDDRQILTDHINRIVLPGGEDSWSEEFRIIHPIKGLRWIWGTGKVDRNDDGQATCLAGINMDITERREAQRKVSESEERFRGIFEHAPTGISITDLDGHIVHSNPALCRILGYGAEELRLTDFRTLVHPEDREENVRMVQKLLAGAVSWFELDNRYIRKCGQPVWVHKFVSLLRGSENQPKFLMALVSDISERRRAEEALKQSERRYRRLHESLRDAFVSISMRGRILDFNHVYQDMLGYEAAELRRMTHRDLTPKTWHELEDQIVKNQVLARDYSEVYEQEYRRKDGTVIPVELRLFLMRDGEGKPATMWAIVRDITKRKENEQRLRESEVRLRLALEGGAMGSWEWDLATNKLQWNRREFELLGIPVEDRTLDAGEFFARIHPEDQPGMEDRVRRTLDHDGDFDWEFRIIRLDDGRERWLAGHGHLIRNSEGKPLRVYGVNFDITERKAAQHALEHVNATLEAEVTRRTAALADSERRMRAIVDTAVDGIVVIDENGTIESANPAAAGMTGYAIEELIGRNVSVLAPSPHREQHHNYLANFLRTGHARIIGRGRELLAAKKNGEFLPIHLSVTQFIESEQRRFVGFIRDISSRKKLERTILDISEREQRRIGRDLHDGLGQEITAISMLNSVLRDDLARRGAEEEAMASRVGELLTRARDEVRHISRGLSPVAADPRGLMSSLEDLADFTSQSVINNVKCQFECGEPVLVDSDDISINLYRIAQEALSNALRHARASRIIIRLMRVNDWIALEIEDNGCGSGAAQTTSGGMGLSTMRYRADALNGHLDIQNLEEGGTLVRCCVPWSGRNESVPN